jgi:hypothetical protein
MDFKNNMFKTIDGDKKTHIGFFPSVGSTSITRQTSPKANIMKNMKTITDKKSLTKEIKKSQGSKNNSTHIKLDNLLKEDTKHNTVRISSKNVIQKGFKIKDFNTILKQATIHEKYYSERNSEGN